MGLALSCDLVIAKEGATFGTPEINVGAFPYMIMAIIYRNVPRKKVNEMMLLGERLSAEQAVEYGLANKVVPAAEFDAAVADWAGKLASKSPVLMRLGHDAMYRQQDMAVDDALEFLRSQLSLTFTHRGHRRGRHRLLREARPAVEGKMRLDQRFEAADRRVEARSGLSSLVDDRPSARGSRSSRRSSRRSCRAGSVEAPKRGSARPLRSRLTARTRRGSGPWRGSRPRDAGLIAASAASASARRCVRTETANFATGTAVRAAVPGRIRRRDQAGHRRRHAPSRGVRGSSEERRDAGRGAAWTAGGTAAAGAIDGQIRAVASSAITQSVHGRGRP